MPLFPEAITLDPAHPVYLVGEDGYPKLEPLLELERLASGLRACMLNGNLEAVRNAAKSERWRAMKVSIFRFRTSKSESPGSP